MVIGATYGTFDLFHIGHLRLLERAREQCDKLIVFVSTDEFNELKNKKCTIPFFERATIVEALKCVDDVYEEKQWEQKQWDINLFNIDKVFMGDDWKGKFDDLPCEVIYLPRTKGISSTMIKEKLK